MKNKILLTTAFILLAILAYSQTPANLSGYFEDNVNYLTWELQNEDEFDHFQVEKEKDDGTYITIGDQVLVTKSTIDDQYTFRDDVPYMGRNNYRLKMVRPDGSFAYSNNSYILVERLPEIHVYPLPANDLMTIELANFDIDTNAEIRLLNAAGTPVWRRALFPGDFEKIDVNVQKITPGNYILEVVDEDFRRSKEIIIR